MDYLDELRENQLDRVDQIEKAFDSTYIEKGKKAQIGEIRQWKDGKYQMTTNGWVYIKGSDPNIKGKKKSEEPSKVEPKPVEKPVAKEPESLVKTMKSKMVEDFKSAAESYNSSVRRLEELKGRGISLYSKDYTSKRILNDAWNAREKAERNLDRIKYGSAIVKKVMRGLGIKASESTSTAIRGFSTYSSGYELSEYDKSSINIIGIGKQGFDNIVDKLKEAGIKIVHTQEPSKSIGAGMVGSIKIAEVYPEFFKKK